jgi:EAL domain-containing protein (putative c-di-GMP-specific phosphodiesterase class I)
MAAALNVRIKEIFGVPFVIEGQELIVSVTAGVAVSPTDGSEAELLLQNADAAMRQAKSSSVRCLFYQRAMNATTAETLKLENRLRRALDREEFVLHYQPKVSLADGKIVGVEALIRWNNPETGMVPPIQFVPLLEETGLIVEVGKWVLRRALTDYQIWADAGLRAPRVAVNVSAIQLAQENFVDIVRGLIGEFGGASHGLDLEITESLLMKDFDANIAKLGAIRDMGIKIAIDDFGTGYSSLGYLAKLPIDALKIDRSFVITMADEADGMAIASTIISLARSLDLQVIAEGVEIEDQRRLLRLLKCDHAQGYLFHRPIPAAGIMELLQK